MGCLTSTQGCGARQRIWHLGDSGLRLGRTVPEIGSEIGGRAEGHSCFLRSIDEC